MKVRAFSADQRDIDEMSCVCDREILEIAGGKSRYVHEQIPEQPYGWVSLGGYSLLGLQREISSSWF